MKNFLPVLIIGIVLLACNKPEVERITSLKTGLKFDLISKNGFKKTWNATSSSFFKSDTAIQLIAYNEYDEQLNILLFNNDSNTTQMGPDGKIWARVFINIQGSQDTFVNLHSEFANGIFKLEEINPDISTMSGTFEFRPYHQNKQDYVTIDNGVFTDIPYLSVDTCPSEIEYQNLFKVKDPEPIDLDYCVTRTNCISAIIDGEEFNASGSNVTLVRDTLGRLILTAKNGLKTVKFGLSSTDFENQNLYNLGRNTPNKGYYSTSASNSYSLKSGLLALEFEDTIYGVSGEFEAEIKNNGQGAVTSSITNGLIKQVPITNSIIRSQTNFNISGDLNGHAFVSDTLETSMNGNIAIVMGKDFEGLEGIELQFPDTIESGPHGIGNNVRVYYHNYYGGRFAGSSGTLNVLINDTSTNIINATVDFDVYDFTENTSISFENISIYAKY